MLAHVVAVALNGVIGKKNRIPWHISSDLKFFKELTIGSTVIMGRKTFESIGKPLPGRENFVLSRFRSVPQTVPGTLRDRFTEPVPAVPGTARFFTSFAEALENVTTPKAFIIGGRSLYRETIEHVDRIYFTKIYRTYEGDAYYPTIPEHFKVVETIPLESKAGEPQLEVLVYERVRTSSG